MSLRRLPLPPTTQSDRDWNSISSESVFSHDKKRCPPSKSLSVYVLGFAPGIACSSHDNSLRVQAMIIQCSVGTCSSHDNSMFRRYGMLPH